MLRARTLRGMMSLRAPAALPRGGAPPSPRVAPAAATERPPRRGVASATSFGGVRDESRNARDVQRRAAASEASSSSSSNACPGAKAPLEDVVNDLSRGAPPRGDVGGVRWASARVLALDARARDLRDPPSLRRLRDASWRATLLDPADVPPAPPPQLLSVAPMMDYTTAHFRAMCRMLSLKTWLYTEMEVDQTLTHVDHPRLDRYLDFPLQTHPSVLQLGGSDPESLGRAAAIAAPYAYDELNLNCGCPSPKVAGKGNFGAALMLEPELVADCVAAMAANSGGAPVTVKCRIGVDDVDSYDALCAFVETVAARMPPRRGEDARPLFAIHARKALLSGLSPAENRTVPPLRHEWVHALARDFPDVAFAINGGINTLEEAVAIARGEGTPRGGGRLVGTMIGRRAHADPWGLLARADTAVFGEASDPCVSRRALLETYAAYADATWARYGTTKDGYAVPSIRHLMHPLQNLFLGEPNAKRWRREVDEVLKRDARRATTTVTGVLEETLRVLSDETLDRAPGEVGEARTLFEGSDVKLPSRSRSAVVA